MEKEFYDPDYDIEADHYEAPKCGNCGCGESMRPQQIDGDVCDPCYTEEK